MRLQADEEESATTTVELIWRAPRRRRLTASRTTIPAPPGGSWLRSSRRTAMVLNPLPMSLDSVEQDTWKAEVNLKLIVQIFMEN